MLLRVHTGTNDQAQHPNRIGPKSVGEAAVLRRVRPVISAGLKYSAIMKFERIENADEWRDQREMDWSAANVPTTWKLSRLIVG